MTNARYRPVEISWAPQTPSFRLLYSSQPCRADTQRNSPSGKTNENNTQKQRIRPVIIYWKTLGYSMKSKHLLVLSDWVKIICMCYLFKEYLCHFLWFILGCHQFRKQMANIKHKEKFMDNNLFSEHSSKVNVNKNPV